MAHIVGVPKRDPCQKCGLPVFLAERLMIGKNVYHRTCLRCARCNSQLTPGNFYETEIDGEYCCETCPDEEKKLNVATSSKDHVFESVNSTPLAARLAFFERDGTKVLQKSLSDEEKSQSLKKLTTNQLQSIYKPDTARSNFLSNPPLSGDYDSRNSSRRNSNSSSSTTSSDKTNDDVSQEPPELPKSLPPIFSEDKIYDSPSLHIQPSIGSNVDQNSETTSRISSLENIQIETVICDMPSVGQLPSPEPSFEDALNSGSQDENVEITHVQTDCSGAISQQIPTPNIDNIQIGVCDVIFPNQQITIQPLNPPSFRFRSGDVAGKSVEDKEETTFKPNISKIKTLNLPSSVEKTDDGMDLKSEDAHKIRTPPLKRKNSVGFKIDTKDNDFGEFPPLTRSPKMDNMQFKSDIRGDVPQQIESPRRREGMKNPSRKDRESSPVRGNIEKIQTEKPKPSAEPLDQKRDRCAQFCNNINLSIHKVNSTKDSENDVQMRTNKDPTVAKYTRESKQPIVGSSNSEKSKSMVRTRLHQFEDIANKSQNSSISSLSKNRLSHSTNVDRPQSDETKVPKIDFKSGNDCFVGRSVSFEMEKYASYTPAQKTSDPMEENQCDVNKKEVVVVVCKNTATDNLLYQFYSRETKPCSNKSDKLDKSNKSDESDKSNMSDTLEKSDESDKSNMSDTSEKSDELDTQRKSEEPDKLVKLDNSCKSSFKVQRQAEENDDYPKELNPFKSDDEEDIKKKTNPFECPDEDEDRMRTMTSKNPFGSESEDDNVSSSPGKLPVPTPRSTKLSEKVESPIALQKAMWRSCEEALQNTQDCCKTNRLDQLQDAKSPGVTKNNKKKKPAPQPPKVSKEIFSPINQDSKRSSPGSSTASTPTTLRKKRPAPPPPGPSKGEGCLQDRTSLLVPPVDTASTDQEVVKLDKPQAQLEKLCDEEKALLESGTNISCNEPSSTPSEEENENTKTSKRRLITLDVSLVEDANSSEDLKLKEEDNVIYRRILVPPVLDDSTLSPSSDTSESHDRQLEKMKDNKEAKNRNRQSQISLPSEENDRLYNKSVHGKWKRRKGPAPALPIPPKKVLQMLPLQEIRHELEIIEVQQQGLEKQGVMLEKMIRERCEGPTGGGDSTEGNPNPPNSKEVEDLILQLFELVNEKNELFRRQAELMYLRRQHRLEQEQADLEYEIRVLMAQPERNKTDSDKAREEALIARLVEVVQLRNEVVECLEMDRLREAEEDLSIKQRLEMHSAKRDEELSKQTPTKLSKKEKKKQKEHKKIGKSKKLDADKDADESELSAEKLKAKKKKKKFLF